MFRPDSRIFSGRFSNLLNSLEVSLTRKLKNNTKGFSLVELLVAITVLVIVAVPLLHSFVTAAMTNAKAKKKMEATTVAENVLEQIKGTKLAALLDTTNASVTKNADGTYTVTYDDQTVNGQTFNAKATFDASDYSGDTGENQYNAEKVADVSNMDVLKDAFYVQDSEQDRTYAAKLATDIGGNYSTDLVLTQMSREAIIDIASTKSGSDNVTTVTLTYKYSVGALKTETFQTKIYDNADISNGALRAVYLFYSPLYSSTLSASPLDKITINNDNATPVTVYLVKQSTTSDTTTINEQNYKAAVTVNENAAGAATNWSLDSAYQASTAIRTNIGWSVLKQTDGTYKEISSQLILKYSHLSYSINGDNAKSVLDYRYITGEKSQDRIYKVTVEVFKKADGNEKYSADNLLLSYVGTKED